MMWEHLTAKAPLPEGQVVRTTPRGGTPGTAPPLEPANVPQIAAHARPEHRIAAENGRVALPD
jgi:hydroxybutyrate-dimer hydrolase